MSRSAFAYGVAGVFSISYRFAEGTEYRGTMDKDLYMKAFLNNICFRPSCHSCKSKTFNRSSDITLADFWGIDKVLLDMDDDKETSLVFINTEKGRGLFRDVSEGMVYK